MLYKHMTPFSARVLAYCQKIPPGSVVSYGQLAALAGSIRAARTVGQILHHNTTIPVPWQRVVNARGALSTTCRDHPAHAQKELLEAEGLRFELKDGVWYICNPLPWHIF